MQPSPSMFWNPSKFIMVNIIMPHSEVKTPRDARELGDYPKYAVRKFRERSIHLVINGSKLGEDLSETWEI